MLLAIPRPAEPVSEMYWQRRFSGTPEQARTARAFLRALLPEHPRLDDILLAADELIVNAIQHTRSGEDGGSFGLDVTRRGEAVMVSVRDQGGPTEPAAQESGASLAESGRGLALVSALAGCWTWSGDQRGRTVTLRFAPSPSRLAPLPTSDSAGRNPR